MSFIGGLFSGSQGANWQPEAAATPEQAQELYRQQQEALARQRAFTQALAGQTPEAIQAQKDLLSQISGRVAGTAGPSVAERQMAEATGQGIAGVGAALAGQRGASQNVGLTGRNIATAGAQALQQAAAQGSTLRAQEQIAAQQQLAGLTGQQLGQVQTAQQAEASQAQAQQNALQQAIANRNALMQAMAGGKQEFQAGLIGGLLGAGATAVKGMARGGEVKDDDEKEDFTSALSKNLSQGMQPKSRMGQAGMTAGSAIGGYTQALMEKAPKVLGKPSGGYAGANLGVSTEMPQMINPVASAQNIAAFKPGLAKGGKVPAMVSPGEKYLPPEEVEKVKRGEKEPVSAGRTIPGQAKVKGDSLKNDTVPMTLEEGGIVIPRSVMQSKDPAEQARKFVAAVVAKQKSKRK